MVGSAEEPCCPSALSLTWPRRRPFAGRVQVGVLLLGNMLQSPANAYALLRSGLGWVLGAMPLLQVGGCAGPGVHRRACAGALQ